MGCGPAAGWGCRGSAAAIPGAIPASIPCRPSLKQGDALHPWRYGAWRRKPVCEAVEPEKPGP